MKQNLTEIMPDSLFSKNNNIFKDFNNFFFKNNLNEFNKKKTVMNETKTQETKINQKNFKEPTSAKQKNIISFNSLNMKKDIFNIKKENPIIIKSCEYFDNSSRIIRLKPSLNKYKNSNNVKNDKNKDEISVKKDNEKSYELKEIESYIKVNKMERFKKIFNINSINRSNYSKKDFNKNHSYHEIKTIKNSQKRLSSISQSIIFL